MTVKSRPARQGELDGACGFYAITNALHLLEQELTKEEIFAVALREFFRDGDPMLIVNGTFRGAIKNTLSRTMAALNHEYELVENRGGSPYELTFSIPYWQLEKERDRKDVLDTIALADSKAGRVVIMGYQYNKTKGEEGYNHWTVIRKVTEEGLVTYDSDKEAKLIPYSNIRIDSAHGHHGSRPWNIFSKDLFILSRQPL